MIVACHACPSQYSVPDAKVRGKKVRITCKHCGASIIVDGMDMPASDVAAPSPLPKFNPPPPLQVPSAAGLAARQEDVTLIARPKFGQGLSVHEEPTVIGQIPREALDFERAFAQRTQPPPGIDGPAASAPAAAADSEPLPRFPSGRPSALPEVPENPHDETKRASPRAFARSEPPTGQFVSGPLPRIPSPPLAPHVPTVVIKETRDEPTLVSSALPSLPSPAAALPQRSHAMRVALMLLALALASFLILKLR